MLSRYCILNLKIRRHVPSCKIDYFFGMCNKIFRFNGVSHIFFLFKSKSPSFRVNSRNYSDNGYLNKLLLTMPKDNTHTIVLKNQRIKGKSKSLKYTPGTVTLQVLGSGAKGAPRSLYVFTDHSRYLFNCGEGTQRLAHEHKMKLSKLEHIFITHPSWENVGGLPGVALTIQDVGVPEIILHGPEGVEDIFLATRRFVILKNMDISKAECSRENQFEDNVLKVNYIPLKSNKIRHVTEPGDFQPNTSRFQDKNFDSSNDDTDYYAHEKSKGQNNSLKRKRRFSGSRSEIGKVARTEDISVCYVCRLQARPGSLCLEKCVELGVPPGPLLGRLKAGEDVVLGNGNIVKSSDVTLPDDPGPLFIVIEVPSLDFLPALESEVAFVSHQASATNPEDVAFLVVHFTPPNIVQHPTYIEFMKKFPMSCTHLFLNESNECLGSLAVHRIQYKLNLLDNQMFPLLGDKSIPIVIKPADNMQERNHTEKSSPLPLESSIFGKEGLSIGYGKTLWKASLRPQRFVDSGGLSMDPREFIEEVNKIEGFNEEMEKLKQTLSSVTNQDIKEYPNFVFLGTGSCIPNKTRNTSGILLNLSAEVSMILDCGEGTWGQLYRYYGQDKAKDILSRLRAIYVSHLHADHHIGLIGLLKAASEASSSNTHPLYLIAPGQISTWLTLYHKRFENILDNVRLLPNSFLIPGSDMEGSCDDVLEALGLSSLATCPVVHCPNSFGVAVTHTSGWKITYSGDTMPCDSLIDIGMKSDVLIHEATMEDELIDEAKMKLHSTTSQAISAGSKMEARFTLLTHFSQRYAKLPRFNDSFTDNVGIAFDNMKVRLGDLSKIPLLYPALRLMFQEDYDELEMKAFKRQLKQTAQTNSS